MGHDYAHLIDEKTEAKRKVLQSYIISKLHSCNSQINLPDSKVHAFNQHLSQEK